MEQDIFKTYQQKKQEIQTYARAGKFAIPAEEIQNFLKENDQKLHHSIQEHITEVLTNQEIYNKNAPELKAVQNLINQGLISISYKRHTLWQKITRSKQNPEVNLIGKTEDILQHLEKSGERLLDHRIFVMDLKIDSFRHQIHSQITQKNREEEERERKERFSIPFQDSEDSSKAAINPAHICLVHATKYFPKKNKNGQYEIETTATATDLLFPRNTVHFALNHHVESHLEGAWDSMPYVILTPLDKTSTLNNRNPAGISTVDTFFEMDLNENLKLPPEAFLIYPAKKDEQWTKGQIYKIRKNHAIYKANDSFAQENKLQLVNTILRKKGYQTGWGRNDTGPENDINHQCMRTGEKMGVLAYYGSTLHAATILGCNGINYSMSHLSPSRIGLLSRFIHNAVLPQSKIEKLNNGGFKIKNSKDDIIGYEYDLELLFSKKEAYIQDARNMWDEGIENFKKNSPELLLTNKTKHVFEAWRKKQDEIFEKDLPKFFEKYPTFEDLKKAAEKPIDTLAQKLVQEKKGR